MILLPHPAVGDVAVCSLPQPVVNFLSVAAPVRVLMGNTVAEVSLNLVFSTKAQILL